MLFQTLGFVDGDEVSVEGIMDNIGDEPVLLMSQLSRAGGSLGGGIRSM